MAGDENTRIHIFDTTLRDGEQAPGCSMTLREKLRVAKALSELGVDIIEAGFPAASPGDFEAVQEIASTIDGPTICGLSPLQPRRHRSRWRSAEPGEEQANPCFCRDQRNPSRTQTSDGQRRDSEERRRRHQTCPGVLRRRGIFPRGCFPYRARLFGGGSSRPPLRPAPRR